MKDIVEKHQMKPIIKFYILIQPHISIVPIADILNMLLKILTFIAQADWEVFTYNGFAQKIEIQPRSSGSIDPNNMTPLEQWVANGSRDIQIEYLEENLYKERTQFIKEKTSLLYLEEKIGDITFFAIEPSEETDITI